MSTYAEWQCYKTNLENGELRDENRRLKEALRFYASETNWYYELNSEVVEDGGAKARKELQNK